MTADTTIAILTMLVFSVNIYNTLSFWKESGGTTIWGEIMAAWWGLSFVPNPSANLAGVKKGVFHLNIFKLFLMAAVVAGLVANAAVTGTAEAAKGGSQVLDVVATAYAPGPHDNGKWGNLTYMGTQVRPGIIAVDPKVIPLGSTVYIEFPDGHGTQAVAEDTGGAIKGNRIDIAMWTVAEAYDFGMQKVKVTVLD